MKNPKTFVGLLEICLDFWVVMEYYPLGFTHFCLLVHLMRLNEMMLDNGYDPTWPYVELDRPKVTFKAAIHEIEP
jgi:hypothetical protein